MSLHTYVVLAYKESMYLEECIKSVLHQEYDSKVVIATSTYNSYIQKLANKYDLEIIVNPKPGQGIGYDFDFAKSCGTTELVTIAHQDDIYEYTYSKRIVDAYKKQQDALILFSDYFEIKNGEKVYSNINLLIKRILLTPLKTGKFLSSRWMKRSCICAGNAICCPAVTFVVNNIKKKSIFASNMKCDIDWLAWERLSNEDGAFVFVNDSLMGHRVHEESTTTEIIRQNIRTKEDYEMFCKFWPKWFATFINGFYKLAEKSNQS